MSKMVFLAIAGIPDPVDKEVGGVEQEQRKAIPVIHRWRMICQVYCAMAVAERNACEIPENEHEPPFLIVHVPKRSVSKGSKSADITIPSCDNVLFSLRACICVQKMGHDKEPNFS